MSAHVYTHVVIRNHATYKIHGQNNFFLLHYICKITKGIKMKISGLQKVSLVDYDGQISATIFTSGCNFACPFCHNSGLVKGIEPEIPTGEILEYLTKRKNVLTAVCISGGEPTLHKDLPELIAKIKSLGYLVKLDTNGTNLSMLKYLVDNQLIDYIAMDIKNSLDNYNNTTGTDKDFNIKETIDYIMSCGIDYEFRTTLLNMPITVGSGAIITIDAGEAGQKMQIAVKCSEASEIWERMYFSSAWHGWKKVYGGSGKILWSGAFYMTETHTITLAEPISKQPNGIVLVFSRYANGEVGDHNFNSSFVSKVLVAEKSGAGSMFYMMADPTFLVLAAKYLYITDTTIKGHANNDATGTSTTGITYANNGFVLRYVIGV